MIYHNPSRDARASRILVTMLLCVGITASLAAPRAAAQSGDALNRFAQTGAGNDAALQSFQQGRTLIDERRWAQAVTAFNRFVAENPSDRNVDAALYWLAHAYEKQNKLKEADETLDRLIERHPRSTWINDARALKVIVKSKLDPQSVAAPKPTDEDQVYIAALNAVCQTDRARCSSVVSDVLRSNRSVVVKESALKLLGRHGGAETVPSLIQLARTEQNERLRMSAISALGSSNDERAVELLREIALSANFADESPTDSAIHALAGMESPRALAALVEVILNGRNNAARQHAVDLLSRRRGDDTTDALFRIYDTVTDAQVRARALSALGRRRDPRATARLVEVARNSSDVELRKLAIRAIPETGDEANLNLLLSLYDTERSPELKSHILESVSRFDNPRARQKLMQVARDSNEPVARRTRAIQILSRSKDPEVLRFLESLIK